MLTDILLELKEVMTSCATKHSTTVDDANLPIAIFNEKF